MAKNSSLICFLLLGFLCIDMSLATEDDKVRTYLLKKGDFSVRLTNWGASILTVMVPDRYGNVADIALGFKSLNEYMNDTQYFGGIVGRVANRIGGAKFNLSGTTYNLTANEGKNTLNGGDRGFSDVIWFLSQHSYHSSSPHVTFVHNSYNRDQGFPGHVAVSVTYQILENYKLSVRIEASALSRPTPVNLAQHTYWNLAGHDSGDVLSNTIVIYASHITPVDDELIPTGKIESVNGSAYDFRRPHTIGGRINKLPNGYDINYVLDGPKHNNMRKAAMVYDSKSGRIMKLWTDQPGLQFYTGNKLKDVKGKKGAVYGAHAGFCLVSQGFPDAVNHPNFPSQILNAGSGFDGPFYYHNMLYEFSHK